MKLSDTIYPREKNPFLFYMTPCSLAVKRELTNVLENVTSSVNLNM